MKMTELKFKIRDAWHSEIPQIVALANDFFKESDFSRSGLTVDLVAYRKTIENYWRYPSVKSIVALDEEMNVLGYVHLYCQRDYTVELVGELYQFYVKPEYRKTPVPRALVEAACKQFDEWGCARSYAECAPGLPDKKSIMTFTNLWRKFGYQQVGVTLLRETKYGGQITVNHGSAGNTSADDASGERT